MKCLEGSYESAEGFATLGKIQLYFLMSLENFVPFYFKEDLLLYEPGPGTLDFGM